MEAATLAAVAAYAAPLASRLRLGDAAAAMRRELAWAASSLDARLSGVPPHVVALLTLTFATACFAAFDVLGRALARARRRPGGPSAVLFASLRALPFVDALVQRQSDALLRKLAASRRAKAEAAARAAEDAGAAQPPPALLALPAVGAPAADVLDMAWHLADGDPGWTPGLGRFSGCVYMSDVEHFALLNKVYARYAHYNPLHADMFAAAVRMEREVVAMTASLLGGGPGGASSVCGCVTSGGSESILTAIRATRDFFAAARGGCGADAGAPVPELVAATTAHAAVHKACAYFGVRLVTVPVDSRGGLCVASARRAVRPGVTALIYASAPGFPHGVVDDVPALGALALQAGCGLHVDACLGAFVLPFAAEAGHPALGRQPFDFSVPGVTSMSADTHKFGQAAKGSSVVLYGGAALRRCQYTAVTDWPGGLYVSPGAPGSRPGGLVACAWAALVHLGRDGLVAATRRILDAAAELAAGVAATPGLAPLGAAAGGSPTMVVAFRSTDARVPIFVVNDVLTQMGWHLNALQRPPALHFCVTAANCGAVPELVQALGEAVASVRARGGAAAAGSGGMAPVYGLAGGVPDRGAVGDLLKGVQDQILDT